MQSPGRDHQMGELRETNVTKPPARAGKITVTRSAAPFGNMDPVVAADERRFALIFSWGNDSVVRFLAGKEAVVVGREEPADILLEDPSVSRQHVRFLRDNDRVFVEDLGSHNGTLLHGRRIRRERLEPGDELRIGETRVLLACTGSVDRIPASLVARDPVLVSGSLVEVYEEVTRAARADSAVLVLGETGTGKEHIAQTLHLDSARQAGPLVVVNCAAIAPHLLEDTFFGPEPLAPGQTAGAFARAHRGTLFLDEVGELTPSAQTALHSALETGRVRRTTTEMDVPWSVRIVSATYCDLENMVDEGMFRRDLYDRLAGRVVRVPPLRERPEAIGPLVQRFLAVANDDWSLTAKHVSPEAMSALVRYHWPGNVRQLKQAIERAALLCAGATINLTDLPVQISTREPPQPIQVPVPDATLSFREQIRAYEVALIERALERTSGDRRAAAKLLRVPVRTLLSKMRTTMPPGPPSTP